MLRILLSALFLLVATPARTWDWDLHFRIAVAAGVPSPAAHGVSYPDMVRPHIAAEAPRHYMNADYFPGGYVLGTLPVTYETFAVQVTAPEKMGLLLYEILHYVGEYRANRALLRHGDFNENQLRVAHYAADLYMPLHLTGNYDGQMTGQRGAHERIEDYGDAAITRVKAAPFPAISSDAELWRVLQSEAARNRALAADVLAADAAALRCGKPYDRCFGAKVLMQSQADRAAGFLRALLAYMDASAGETRRYGHRE